MPFTINVQASGMEHRYELARSVVTGGYVDHNSDYGTTVSMGYMFVTVDTSGSYLSDSVKYSLNGDVLTYSKVTKDSLFGPPTFVYTSVRIVFAQGKDSIVSITISSGDSTQSGYGLANYDHYNFAISNLAFDNTNIFSSDTSFQHHSISYTESHLKINYYRSDYDYDKSYQGFIATSASLSGIFRPITLGKGGIGIGCPWKVPFTIQVHASGESTTSGYFTPVAGPETALFTSVMPDTQDISFTIDSTYTMRNDTLRSNGEGANESIMIVFAHGVDSIISVTCTKNSGIYSITVSGFRFDSTGIYSLDSSFRRHSTSCISYSGSSYAIAPNDYIRSASRFVASAANLSGVFKQVTLKDSVRPFTRLHFPFQIAIHGEGTLDSLGKRLAASKVLLITVWHSTPSSRDTLFFRSGRERSWLYQSDDTSLEIDFVPGTDSVSKIKLSMTTAEIVDRSVLGQHSWDVDRTSSVFMAEGLDHDSTSIFTSDSSLCAHHITMTSMQSSVSYDDISRLRYDTAEQFSAASVDLSGIFRPIHYACDESVVKPVGQGNALAITSSPEGLHCSFDPSDHVRTLEVYSILGIEVARDAFSAGATQATIPNLAPGFYFVRLGNDVAKVAIQ